MKIEKKDDVKSPYPPYKVEQGKYRKGNPPLHTVRTDKRFQEYESLARASQTVEMLNDAWHQGRESRDAEVERMKLDIALLQDALQVTARQRDEAQQQMVNMELVNPIEDKVLGGLRTRLKGKLIPMFASMFADLFIEHNGIHYVTFEMEDARLGVYELTISRITGEENSPARKLMAADQLFDRVINVIGNICPNTNIGDEQLSKMNPCLEPDAPQGRALYYVLRDVKKYRQTP